MPEDQDPRETQEWREALDSVVEFDGPERAAFLLDAAAGGGPPPCRPGAVLGQHGVPQHDLRGQAAAASR